MMHNDPPTACANLGRRARAPWLPALALLLGCPALALAQGPWRGPEEARGQPYAPSFARPATGPTPGSSTAPPAAAAPPGRAVAPGPGAPAAGFPLRGVPRLEGLPGLPPPSGLFDDGWTPPRPKLRPHDGPGCVAALADAVAYQLGGSYQAAALVAREAVGACPEVEEAAVVLGIVQLLAQQTRQASQTLEAAYTRGPRAAEALTVMGLWCLFLGDSHGAQENLNEALLKSPGAWRARLALATLQLTQGNQGGARRTALPLARREAPLRSVEDLDLLDLNPPLQELLQAAVTRHAPACGPCRRTLADLSAQAAGRRRGLAAQARWQRAIELLSALVEEQPADGEARLALGRALGAAGANQAAAEVLEAGLRRGDARFELPLAGTLLDLEQPDRALPLLQRAVARESQRAELWSLLGTAQRVLGLPEAAGSLRRATTLDPSRHQDWSDLGQVLLGAGQPAEAEQAYRKALARQPQLRQARYGLALALGAQGKREESTAEMKGYQALLERLQQQLTRQERQGNLDSATFDGLEHLQAGRLEPARAALAPVLAEIPQHAVANFGMAMLLAAQGQEAQAGPYLDRLLAVSARANGFVRPGGGPAKAPGAGR